MNNLQRISGLGNVANTLHHLCLCEQVRACLECWCVRTVLNPPAVCVAGNFGDGKPCPPTITRTAAPQKQNHSNIWTRRVSGAILLCLQVRSEEHTSELQSLMRISYAVFCWKKKNK